MSSWHPGDPLAQETMTGAIVEERQLDQIRDYIDSASAEGAGVLLGGQRARMESKDFYLEPTVLHGVNNSIRVAGVVDAFAGGYEHRG